MYFGLKMHDFHCNYIKKNTVKIQNCYLQIYQDFHNDRDLFGNSDYDKSSKFYFLEYKKVMGKLKDEAAGLPITEFVDLKSKIYSYTTEKKNNKACKQRM